MFQPVALTNFDSCSHIIDGVINYAAGPLSKQIQLTGDTKSHNLAVIGKPVLKSYHMLFGVAYPTPLGPKIVEARKQLVQLYNQQSDAKTLLNHLLNGSTKKLLNISYIKTLLGQTNNNLQLFTYAINCYKPGKEESCPNIMNTINKNINLKIIPEIDKFKHAYLWGCLPNIAYPGTEVNVYTGYPNAPYVSYISGQTPISGNFTWSNNNTKVEFHGVSKNVSILPEHIYGNWILQGNNIYRGYVGGAVSCPAYSYLAVINNPL